jgi:hypothetical protein
MGSQSGTVHDDSTVLDLKSVCIISLISVAIGMVFVPITEWCSTTVLWETRRHQQYLSDYYLNSSD